MEVVLEREAGSNLEDDRDKGGEDDIGDDVRENDEEIDDMGVWHTAGEKKEQRALRRTDRQLNAFEKKWELSKFKARFMAIDSDNAEIKNGFTECNMLKLYRDLRPTLPSCELSLNDDGFIIVTVSSESEISIMRSITAFGGVLAKLVPSESTVWARITGVPIQIEDKDIKDALIDEGVIDVKREVYYTVVFKSGKQERVQRRSQRVRLRFDRVPPEKVSLGFPELFPVTLCTASVFQCFACNKFDHKAEDCKRKDNPLCRKCSQPGHQAWQCVNESFCLNCMMPHSPRDPAKCKVLGKRATNVQVRQLSRVVSDFPGLSLCRQLPTSEPSKELPTTEKSHQPKQINTDGRKSYAQAAKPSHFKKDGQALCRVTLPAMSQGKPTLPGETDHARKPRVRGCVASEGPCHGPKTKKTELSLPDLWDRIKSEFAPLLVNHPMLQGFMSLMDIFLSAQINAGSSPQIHNV